VAEGGRRSERLTARPDGTFLVHLAPGAPTRLRLRDPGSTLAVELATLPPDTAERYLRLPLAATRVTGRLERRGQALAGAAVELVTADGAPAAGGTSLADGTVSAAFLKPGPYGLRVDGRTVAAFEVREGEGVDLGRIEVERR
jgi:hypothetical protein